MQYEAVDQHQRRPPLTLVIMPPPTSDSAPPCQWLCASGGGSGDSNGSCGGGACSPCNIPPAGVAAFVLAGNGDSGRHQLCCSAPGQRHPPPTAPPQPNSWRRTAPELAP